LFEDDSEAAIYNLDIKTNYNPILQIKVF